MEKGKTSARQANCTEGPEFRIISLAPPAPPMRLLRSFLCPVVFHVVPVFCLLFHIICPLGRWAAFQVFPQVSLIIVAYFGTVNIVGLF